jgi:hypothetical protein
MIRYYTIIKKIKAKGGIEGVHLYTPENIVAQS